MLQSSACRVVLQFKLFSRSVAISRFLLPTKKSFLTEPIAWNQRTLLRFFSSINQSREDSLDQNRKRKTKKLLEPSNFDTAVTFEEAFGQQVMS
jgi:hypothetical protein